jgi:Lrp/AsnC family leucine-responsive transcriptional regulator
MVRHAAKPPPRPRPELDATDREILRLLQRDGRMTNAALADAVGLTATPMLQRIRKLEQSGAIRGYQAIVSTVAVGRPTTAFVHVTLREHSYPVHEAFLKKVESFEEVLECHHIAGDEDFLLKVVVRDIVEFEAFLLRRLTSSPGIARVKTTFVLSTAKENGLALLLVALHGDRSHRRGAGVRHPHHEPERR